MQPVNKLITPFKNQQKLVQKRFQADSALASVTVGTVHKIQGQEADVVIYSPVNPRSYFINQSEKGLRMNNVALSRAKQHLVLLGSTMKLRRNVYLASFVNQAHQWAPQWRKMK